MSKTDGIDEPFHIPPRTRMKTLPPSTKDSFHRVEWRRRRRRSAFTTHSGLDGLQSDSSFLPALALCDAVICKVRRRCCQEEEKVPFPGVLGCRDVLFADSFRLHCSKALAYVGGRPCDHFCKPLATNSKGLDEECDLLFFI